MRFLVFFITRNKRTINVGIRFQLVLYDVVPLFEYVRHLNGLREITTIEARILVLKNKEKSYFLLRSPRLIAV